jgi:hypothetical protein
MSEKRRAGEQSREQATDVLETWKRATVQILAAADNPDFLDGWLALAKRDVESFTVGDRAREASKLVAGELAIELFNPAFVEHHRRLRIAAQDPELPDPDLEAS